MEAEADVKVRTLRMSRISQRRAYRTEHAIVIIRCLAAEHRAVVKQAAHPAAALSEGQARHDIVVVGYALLPFQLEGEQRIVDKLYVSDTGERQLLLDILAGEHAADGVAHYQRDVAAQQTTAVEHRLDNQAGVQRERHAPHEVNNANAGLAVPAYEVVGMIAETDLELCAARGEKPTVFRVVIKIEDVTVEVNVIELALSGRLTY